MLEILYRNDYLVAVNKPPGLLVHKTGLDAAETRFALQAVRDQLGQTVWPVHRLDKGTSGVLLFALNADAARQIGRAFVAADATGCDIHKTYLAIVRGWPVGQGLIDHPLGRMRDDHRPDRLSAQAAQTHFRCLERYELPLVTGSYATTRCALVELQPLTGRRHQLRRHLKHIAHPIIGDATHGKGPLNRALAGLLATQRLWLHAARLELRLSAVQAPLVIAAPPDLVWREWYKYRSPLPLGAH